MALAGLGPPMEVCPRANLLTLLLYGPTTFGLNLNQCCEVGKMLVDQRFICQRPQALGWLQFRRIGRQSLAMQPFGHHYFVASVPASIVLNQENLHRQLAALWPYCPNFGNLYPSFRNVSLPYSNYGNSSCTWL